MCDDKLRQCEVAGCYGIAVGEGSDGRRLCDPHYFERVVPKLRECRGKSYMEVDQVPRHERHLIGVYHVTGAATHLPPGHYFAKCDVCGDEDVIGPNEYPYPVCGRCDERYERGRHGEV